MLFYEVGTKKYHPERMLNFMTKTVPAEAFGGHLITGDMVDQDAVIDVTPVKSKEETGLELLRKPFADHQVSKMCRPTKRENQKARCPKCNGWHGIPSIQLSYVGHAALTDRLLDADPTWSWEPLALNEFGTPKLDNDGGMWIKLTVCGVTRLGYGDAQGKSGGDAMKERIGDALRNAAMRFGAALDLWHKGDLHGGEDAETIAAVSEETQQYEEAFDQRVQAEQAIAAQQTIAPYQQEGIKALAKQYGRTDDQLVAWMKVNCHVDRVEKVLKRDFDQFKTFVMGKEPLEQSLKTSVQATQKPQAASMTQAGSKITEPQLKRLHAIRNSKKVSEEDVKTYVRELGGPEHLADLTRPMYQVVTGWLESVQS
jgi:hypothetical protein